MKSFVLLISLLPLLGFFPKLYILLKCWKISVKTENLNNFVCIDKLLHKFKTLKNSEY